MPDYGSSKDVEGSEHRKMRYYTLSDVALHNCAEDCWLSLFGQVRRYVDIARGTRRARLCDATIVVSV